MKKIILTKRSGDVKVHLDEHPEIWDAGKNADEAIGKFVFSHPEECGLSTSWSKDNWTQRYVRGDPLTEG